MPRARLVPVCAWPLLLAISACGGEEEAMAPEVDTSKYATPFTAPEDDRKPPAVTFTDVTASSGVDFVHQNGAFGNKYLPETMGSGVTVFDADGDGVQDLLFVQSRTWEPPTDGPPPTLRLFRGLGGLRFEDVTQAFGLDLALYGMGACAADADGDGDQDLYVTCLGPNRFLRNDGGRFVDATEEAGLAGGTWADADGVEQASWSTGAAWLDHDADGHLDLFVCNYVRWTIDSDIPTTLTGIDKAYTQPRQYDGDTCRLYRNLGNGRFEDVTQAAGLWKDNAKALGVAVHDFNGDGRPDLVVSNDTQPNFLFESQPDGTWKDVAQEAGIAYDEAGRARAGMGVDVADFEGEGEPAIVIGNFTGEPVSLYQRREGGLYVPREAAARISRKTLPTLTFALVFFDFDLDGALDLFACNGHIEPEIHAVQQNVTYAQPLQLFWNQGKGRFAEMPAVHAEPVVGRGASAADLDGDGDLDLVVTRNNGPALLLRNDQDLGHHWLRVRLEGKGPNTDAMGARVELVAEGRTQVRIRRTGSSYLSQGEAVLSFGLGAATVVERLTVHWPGGGTSEVPVDRVDQELVVRR